VGYRIIGASNLHAPVVVDAHNDLLMLVDHFRADPAFFGRQLLPQLRAGQVGVQILPVYLEDKWSPEMALRRTLELIEQAHRVVETSPDDLLLCLDRNDIDLALASGRIGIVLALEGCAAIGNDVDLLETLHRLGVRVGSLTHFGRNGLAEGSAEGIPGGRLSRVGARAIETMERVGIVVDVSHLSLASTRHVLELVSKPVIASHSSADALVQHHRNLPDDELRAIAATGGVIGVNFYPPFLSRSGTATVADVIAHIEHIAEVAGIEHVGLGPDFTKELAETLYPEPRPIVEGVDLASSVAGIEGPADLPTIADELAKRGFDDAAVRGVMGRNFIRVLRELLEPPTFAGAATPGGA
jgi:membrane dipeptidase